MSNPIDDLIPHGGVLSAEQQRRFLELVKDRSVMLESVVEIPLEGSQAELAALLPEPIRLSFHRLCGDYETATYDSETEAHLLAPLKAIAGLVMHGWRWVPSSKRKAFDEGSVVAAQDDELRCAACARWLVEDLTHGCVRGNCSSRPIPERLYAPERFVRENGPAAAATPKTEETPP